MKSTGYDANATLVNGKVLYRALVTIEGSFKVKPSDADVDFRIIQHLGGAGHQFEQGGSIVPPAGQDGGDFPLNTNIRNDDGTHKLGTRDYPELKPTIEEYLQLIKITTDVKANVYAQ